MRQLELFAASTGKVRAVPILTDMATMRFSTLFITVLGALLLLSSCGSTDDSESAPEATSAPTVAAEAPVQADPEPTAEPTEIPADPTPEATATPLPTIAAPTVPSVASTACDRVPFSVWNAEGGNKLSFGDLNQFEFVDAGASRVGGWACEGDVVTGTLNDGSVVEAVYSADPSVLSVDGVAFLYNQAESFFQE